ncbi:hypothetical protein NDU88_004141 [Pleurodeles waltl]|uniref:Uncharacterized protein n=1 Tax=Pleurodeles waltl TaxID=8319 RepID=A0AAV7MSM2_PLEWA|nr:hypothetical protein NDU88_004141 [Pleurodeles waltl]
MQVQPRQAPLSLPRHPRRRSRPAPRAPVQPQGPTSGPAVPGSPGPSRRCDPSAADNARRSPVGPPSPLGRSTASRSRRPFTQGLDRSARLHTGADSGSLRHRPRADSPPAGPRQAAPTPLLSRLRARISLGCLPVSDFLWLFRFWSCSARRPTGGPLGYRYGCGSA